MMKRMGRGGLIGLGVLALGVIIVLSMINLVQRHSQPRYQVPGRIYLVSVRAQGQPTDQKYYVFSPDRSRGEVLVTPDKKAAQKAVKSKNNFEEQYQAQTRAPLGIPGMQAGAPVPVTWTYQVGHHDLTVQNVANNNQFDRQTVLSTKNLKFKDGHSVGKISLKNDDPNVPWQVSMKLVKDK